MPGDSAALRRFGPLCIGSPGEVRIRGKLVKLFIARSHPFLKLPLTKALEQFDIALRLHCRGALALNQRLEVFLLPVDPSGTADYETFELGKRQKIATVRRRLALCALPLIANLILQIERLLIKPAHLPQQLLQCLALRFRLLKTKFKDSLKPEFKCFHGTVSL